MGDGWLNDLIGRIQSSMLDLYRRIEDISCAAMLSRPFRQGPAFPSFRTRESCLSFILLRPASCSGSESDSG